MTYRVMFSDSARRQIMKMERNVQTRLIAALERIRIRPEAYVTKLIGDPGYKLRVGEYRILLDIDTGESQILVLKVGHRKNIYRNLPPE